MKQNEALAIFEKADAIILEDHIIYTSGKHGSAYINKDAVYPHTAEISKLCGSFAKHFADKKIDVVIAPALGGIILSQWTAHHLSLLTGQEVLSAYSEKNDSGDFVIKRGYDKLIRKKRILVVEDILTTGGSVKKVVEQVRLNEGDIVGVAALCNRGQVQKETFGDIPELYSLLEVEFDTYEAEKCPLCEKGIPVNTSVGKGKNFNEKSRNSLQKSV